MVRATATPAAKKAPATKPAAKKAPATKTTKKTETPAPVETPVVETPVVADADAAATEGADKNTLSGALMEEIVAFNKNFAVWQSAANAMKANIKNIAKISARVSKNAEKSSKKKKNNNSGKLSGFEKPTLISDELAVFFGKEKGSRMARTEVSKMIHKYVKDNSLQNKDNRRIIHPDAKLKKLLDSKDEELTYFNLQKYLKHHFKKDAPATA
jgi:chromatin remodeling complex protein RSC6